VGGSWEGCFRCGVHGGGGKSCVGGRQRKVRARADGGGGGIGRRRGQSFELQSCEGATGDAPGHEGNIELQSSDPIELPHLASFWAATAPLWRFAGGVVGNRVGLGRCGVLPGRVVWTDHSAAALVEDRRGATADNTGVRVGDAPGTHLTTPPLPGSSRISSQAVTVRRGRGLDLWGMFEPVLHGPLGPPSEVRRPNRAMKIGSTRR